VKILGVLDVLGGKAVHAIAGNRAEYEPLSSRWSATACPLEVGKSLVENVAIDTLYLADLDSITKGQPNWWLYRDLQQIVPSFWLDAGVRTSADARLLREAGIQNIVTGLETLDGADQLAEILEEGIDPIFSLDLREGSPLGNWDEAVEGILDNVLAMGVSRLLVLDLARVGVGAGVGTEPLLASIRQRYPQIELYSGGGVHALADLQRLKSLGLSGVLLATALHEGRITREELRRL
jgi:phosphoribosylformimino-5-aminoimidazole carboxamide ribotide isomerase